MKTNNNIKRITKTEAGIFIPNKNYFCKGYRTFFGSRLIKDVLFGNDLFAGVYEERDIGGLNPGDININKTLKLFQKDGVLTHIKVTGDEQVREIKTLLNKASNLRYILSCINSYDNYTGQDILDIIAERVA